MSENDSSDLSRSDFHFAKDAIVGHYRIIDKIGAGGMGDVYLAEDSRLRRNVALKFLGVDRHQTHDSRERFKREAQAAAMLNHPNIVTIFEVGEFGERPYFAMEFVEGRSLREIISDSTMALDRVLDIGIQLCEGLQAAHSRGVVHRDLKPANVMITSEGRIKILDFGLAKTQADSMQTQTGNFLGTVNYMSPEQAQGHPVDQRTDIFVFGVVFYEMLTGVNPLARSGMGATFHAIISDTPPPLAACGRAIPESCQLIVDRMLAKDPQDRYADIGDVALDLKRIQAGLVLDPLTMSMAVPLMVTPVAPDAPSIAVLPFVNMSTDAENEYFADGLSEELLNMLTRIAGLRVAARTSSFRFKNSREDVKSIGRCLNVATILEGSVRKSVNRVRITLQLVKVSDGFHIWSETYDRTLDDLFAVQDDIARSVVEKLRTTLLHETADSLSTARAGAQVAAAARGRGESAKAHRLYLEGQYFVERLTRDDMAKAMGCFRKALDIDPGCALAWEGLSRVYADQAAHGWMPCAEGFELARAAAERALNLEPNLAEGHMRLALIRMSYDWDWSGAVSSISRALKLAPGKVAVLRTAAHLASNLGRLDEAIALVRVATLLDPLNATAYHSLGIYCYSADQFEDAESALLKTLELSPGQVGLWLDMARVRIAMGKQQQALADAKQEPFEPFRLLGLAAAHHACGNDAESLAAVRELIDKYSEDGAYQIAEAWSSRGDVDRAFEWLELAYSRRDPGLPEMNVEPLLRPLHTDPRWLPFLRRFGLGTS